MKTIRHLISLKDISDQDIIDIVNRGAEYAGGKLEGHKPLSDKIIGIYFIKTSTRTRTSFSSGALRLGANIIAYGPNDLQINTGETIEDTKQVLSGMIDGLVVRTAGSPAVLRTLAAQHKMVVINAMTADEHPTQALADLTTMKVKFGELKGLNIAYFGEGNNTAIALAMAISRLPKMQLRFFTPAGYGLPKLVMEYAKKVAQINKTVIEEYHDVKNLPADADIVYTTRWQTTGTTKQDKDWRTKFEPFAVNDAIMDRSDKAIFMHDLPAHRGDEVSTSVIDSDKSIVFEQAHNKAQSAKAVFEWCFQ